MSHPYIPQGTPITVTTDGWWDGYHNGNEPYLSYVGHDGLTKKMHIPHGARVDTHPEKSWPESFTIDKTPKAAEPKLRTDTGEPLDAEPLEQWEVELLAAVGEDTPSKPEPQIGDTVAVALNDENGTTIVGVLVATYDDKFWIEGDDFDLQVPHQGSRITVIEPASPAVPDEPKSSVIVHWEDDPEGKDDQFWEYAADMDLYYWADVEVTWPELWWSATAERGAKVYVAMETTKYERGPVVGG